MKNPLEFYKNRKNDLLVEASILKKKSLRLSTFRLAVFFVTVFLVYLTFGNYPEVFILAFLGVLVFSILVLKHINLQKERAIVNAKITINTIEIDVLHRKFQQLNTGEEFVDTTHFYSNDIDLFGAGSFFQYINRTVTNEGKMLLANTLIENNTTEILEKQNTLKELAKLILWRQHFAALAALVTVKNTTSFVSAWLLRYTVVFSNNVRKLPIFFSIVSLLLMALVFLGFLSFTYLTIWFFLGLFITGVFVKKTSKLYEETNNVREIFKQYYPLLHEIEIQKFSSKILKEKKEIIHTKDKKASEIIKEFSKILNAFDQRNNLIISFFGNGLFLREITIACNVEKWISNYKTIVQEWLHVVAFFDAQNSLANFHFNHPQFVFPTISSSKEIIKANNLGHPLLHSDKRIDNDFTIAKEHFFIVTGANMAGKSTFLRSVSLSLVMANCGLPVCAESYVYTPVKLITSIRNSDSLTEEASYFFSELKRLKFIVDAINTDDYFIILDEILKGTNSKDKADGSKKFIEKLTKSKSTGIIATHDVSLCELENEFTSIKNFYFDAEIINNELHFDYTLKNGICNNNNASFLLKKMKII